MLPSEASLYIACQNIDSGLFIHHGFSTIIAAKKIGANFWCNQQVTIGYNADGNPTIGDNVRIGAGAIVIGNINIGDNVTIGAGATIVKDIPANSLVVGPPPRIICNHIVKRQ